MTINDLICQALRDHGYTPYSEDGYISYCPVTHTDNGCMALAPDDGGGRTTHQLYGWHIWCIHPTLDGGIIHSGFTTFQRNSTSKIFFQIAEPDWVNKIIGSLKEHIDHYRNETQSGKPAKTPSVFLMRALRLAHERN